MLDDLDLSKEVDKKTYKQLKPLLSSRLYRLQKASWDAHVPVVILFEGWDAAGKGTSIQKMTTSLDPRGYKLYPIRAARTYEKKRPWLWRFWQKIPARGEWGIFDRSWYGRVMVERVEEITPEREWRMAYRDIVDFERNLADDGYLILKFFLHISKSEQKRRFQKLSKDPLKAWQVTPEDWEHHRRYNDWMLAYEEAFEQTDTEWAPWALIEATDRRHSFIKISQTLIEALEDHLGLPHDALIEAVPPKEESNADEPEADILPADEDDDDSPLAEELEETTPAVPPHPEQAPVVGSEAASPASPPAFTGTNISDSDGSSNPPDVFE